MDIPIQKTSLIVGAGEGGSRRGALFAREKDQQSLLARAKRSRSSASLLRARPARMPMPATQTMRKRSNAVRPGRNAGRLA